MISHQYRFIFVHIPKTAGTSIEEAFGHFEGSEGRGRQDHRTIRDFEPLGLGTWVGGQPENYKSAVKRVVHLLRKPEYEKNCEKVNAQQYADYFKFTIVRNPWARVFSWYMNVMRDERHLSSLGVSRDVSFQEFLLKCRSNWALRTQMHWLKDFGGQLPFDYIARFESLEADFRILCDRLGCAEQIQLPHRIKGTGEDYRNYYDAETREIVADRYREEIEYFEYSYENR